MPSASSPVMRSKVAHFPAQQRFLCYLSCAECATHAVSLLQIIDESLVWQNHCGSTPRKHACPGKLHVHTSILNIFLSGHGVMLTARLVIVREADMRRGAPRVLAAGFGRRRAPGAFLLQLTALARAKRRVSLPRPLRPPPLLALRSTAPPGICSGMMQQDEAALHSTKPFWLRRAPSKTACERP